MQTYIVVTECAIKYQDKYLIITRPQGVHAGGMLSFPGGKVDLSDAKQGHDTLARAVKREVLEELGLTLLDDIQYVTSSCFEDTTTKQPVIDVIFLCDIHKTELKITPSTREVADYRWMTLEEIQQHPATSPWLIAYCHKANLLSAEPA